MRLARLLSSRNSHLATLNFHRLIASRWMKRSSGFHENSGASLRLSGILDFTPSAPASQFQPEPKSTTIRLYRR